MENAVYLSNLLETLLSEILLLHILVGLINDLLRKNWYKRNTTKSDESKPHHLRNSCNNFPNANSRHARNFKLKRVIQQHFVIWSIFLINLAGLWLGSLKPIEILENNKLNLTLEEETGCYFAYDPLLAFILCFLLPNCFIYFVLLLHLVYKWKISCVRVKKVDANKNKFYSKLLKRFKGYKKRALMNSMVDYSTSLFSAECSIDHLKSHCNIVDSFENLRDGDSQISNCPGNQVPISRCSFRNSYKRGKGNHDLESNLHVVSNNTFNEGPWKRLSQFEITEKQVCFKKSVSRINYNNSLSKEDSISILSSQIDLLEQRRIEEPLFVFTEEKESSKFAAYSMFNHSKSEQSANANPFPIMRRAGFQTGANEELSQTQPVCESSKASDQTLKSYLIYFAVLSILSFPRHIFELANDLCMDSANFRWISILDRFNICIELKNILPTQTSCILLDILSWISHASYFTCPLSLIVIDKLLRSQVIKFCTSPVEFSNGKFVHLKVPIYTGTQANHFKDGNQIGVYDILSPPIAITSPLLRPKGNHSKLRKSARISTSSIRLGRY